jgi:excisionase family DNA binding protein
MVVKTSNEDEFLTVEETAQALAVNVRWVRRAIARRELKYIKLRGLIRIPRSAVELYISRQTVPAAPETARVQKASRRRR